VRVLRSRPVSPEEVDFPCVEQVALLRRHLRQHKPEMVALLTSLPPHQLNAEEWLADNRAAWGIENGLHLRLDVSHLDDQCRVRLPKSMRVMGMLRRFSNSLFMHWRSRQKKPKHKTTTDFFTAMTPNIIAMPSVASMPTGQASKPLRELALHILGSI